MTDDKVKPKKVRPMPQVDPQGYAVVTKGLSKISETRIDLKDCVEKNGKKYCRIIKED